MKKAPEKHYNEFQYVEFIRNPVVKKIDEADLQNIKCVALDYFDFIYTKKVDTFAECMVSENNIPCEAYQSIGLFRKSDSLKSVNPFELNKNIPFLTILQITYNPIVHSIISNNSYYNSDNELNELESLIEKAKTDFINNNEENMSSSKNEFLVNYKIYNTVNATDYCIVLSSNYLDFSIYLSNTIRKTRIESNGKSYLKFSVYTVMGISKEFNTDDKETHKYMSNDTVMVARIHLSEKFFEGQNDKFIKNLTDEETHHKNGDVSLGIITDTHTLPGRYDLSIRLNGYKNIVKVLPFVLNNIFNTFFGKDFSDSSSLSFPDEDNTYFTLVRNNFAEYINVRMFFNCKYNLNSDTSGKKLTSGKNKIGNKDDSLTKLFTEIISAIDCLEIGNSTLDGYKEKIQNIIHIYTALLPRYDTHISIKMLESYLIAFLNLIKLNLELVKEKYVDLDNFKLNLISGINYIQKYIEIVSSVNGSTFEAPKYEVEKDECSIVKLPIAYTEFLSEVFNEYYEKRKNINDAEFVFFPKYCPLVIPYMHTIRDAQSDYMMTTLFSQNIVNDWSPVKEYWKKYISDNLTPIYIICQDMKKYKDISSMIASSFHELGHYCNGMTRKQRNSDLVELYIDCISKSIVKAYLSLSNASYQIQNLSLLTSYTVQHLKKCIYLSLVEFFLGGDNKKESGFLENYLCYPSNIFFGKLYEDFENLFNVYLDINSKNLLKKELNDSYLRDYNFIFGETQDSSIDEANETSVISFIVNDCIDKTSSTINSIQNNIDNLPSESSSPKLSKSMHDLESVNSHLRSFRISGKTDILDKFKGNSFDQLVEQCCDCFEKISKELTLDNNNKPYYQIIKKDLISIKECLLFIAKTTNKYNLIYFEENSNETINRKQLSIFVKNKTNVIDRITELFFDGYNIFDDASSQNFWVMYSNLEILPDSNKERFKNLISAAFKGLNVPYDNIEQMGSCYEESIADIVMCVNLNLSLEEYLIEISDLYYDTQSLYAYQTASRLVIVSSYLLFKKEFEELNVNDDNEMADNLFNTIKIEYENQFTNFCNKNKINNSISNLIFEHYENTLDSILYRVTFNRICLSIQNMKIINDNNSFDVSFVKESILAKPCTNNEKQSSLQNREIDFILKYYYKNRKKYAESI